MPDEQDLSGLLLRVGTMKKNKFIHEGKYAAEVDVELIVNEDERSPYLSLDEAYKLDEIREALRKGDLKSIVGKAKVYELHPIAV